MVSFHVSEILVVIAATAVCHRCLPLLLLPPFSIAPMPNQSTRFSLNQLITCDVFPTSIVFCMFESIFIIVIIFGAKHFTFIRIASLTKISKVFFELHNFCLFFKHFFLRLFRQNRFEVAHTYIHLNFSKVYGLFKNSLFVTYFSRCWVFSVRLSQHLLKVY